MLRKITLNDQWQGFGAVFLCILAIIIARKCQYLWFIQPTLYPYQYLIVIYEVSDPTAIPCVPWY